MAPGSQSYLGVFSLLGRSLPLRSLSPRILPVLSMIAELPFSPTEPVFSRRAVRSIGVRTLMGITSPTVISGEEEDLVEEDLEEEEDLEVLK